MMEKHGGHWTAEDNAYGKGKTDCEVMIYEWGPKHNVECMSSCPSVVLGPLLAVPHDMTWQHRLGEMFAGYYHMDILWNVTDVRDIAQTQRLMAESSAAVNGSRYLNCAPSATGDDGFSIGELTSNEVVGILREEFPEQAETMCGFMDYPAGECGWGSKRNGQWSLLAEQELGLVTHSPRDTIVDTVRSMIELQLIGKVMTIQELREFYNVSEMDGCDEEMDYVVGVIQRRADGGDPEAVAARAVAERLHAAAKL